MELYWGITEMTDEESREYDRMCAVVLMADEMLTHYKDKAEKFQRENELLKAEINLLRSNQQVYNLRTFPW